MPYSTSNVLVEALTFNKFVLNQYLRGYGITVADSLLIRKGYEEVVSDDEIEERIGMPCFVKPAADGSSFGVSKVKNKDQLAPAIRKAILESSDVMVESYLEGTEISIGCYKTREKSVVLPATEVVTSNEFFDYDAKYNGQVQEITPARLSEETAQRVAHLAHLRHSALQRHHPHRLYHRQGQGTQRRNGGQNPNAGNQHHPGHDPHQLHPTTGKGCRTGDERRAHRYCGKPVLNV